MATQLQIGEVAAQAGVATSTIRYYEHEGVLPAAARVNGRRQYGNEAVAALALIGVAKRAGFTLAEIKTMLHGFSGDTPPSQRWNSLARAKLADIDERIAQLEAMKLLLREGIDCACLSLDECVVLIGCDQSDVPTTSEKAGWSMGSPGSSTSARCGKGGEVGPGRTA